MCVCVCVLYVYYVLLLTLASQKYRSVWQSEVYLILILTSMA